MRIVAVILGLFISLAACAQEEQTDPVKPAEVTYEAGVHYDVLDIPVKTITPGKIEVTEVFWYGCGHCYTFEPILNRWSETLADDVELVKSPAIWRQNMEAHARILYTAKALDILDKVHPKVFEAMHRDRKPLNSESDIAEFFAQFGIEKEQFTKVYKSFSVSSQVQQAGARARSFQITGTPELVVDGRFRVSSAKAGGQDGMLRVASFLIKQIRDDKI